MFFIFSALVLFFIATFFGVAQAANLYTVHCASYKTEQQALSDVKDLTAKGYAAFSRQVEIKNKSKWYRVYSGKYDTKEKARQAAEEMMKKKVISEYFIFSVSADQPASGNPITKSLQEDKQPKPVVSKSSTGDNSVQNKQDKKLQKKEAKEAALKTVKESPDKIQKDPPALVSEKKSGKTKKNSEEILTPKEEAKSGSDLYDKALGELKEKSYDKALVTFKEFVARNDTPNELGERALRHMADCHFFLGEKGSKEHLQIAVEFYKNTLQSFPDQKRDNALTYYRLGRSYEYLKNYSDSLKSYENVLAKYPDSAYTADASFKIGELLHLSGKYSQAVDKLIAYLMKYRGGSFAKPAFYLVADCYYKMQQSSNTEVWFRDAQKKWPDLTGIPKEVVVDMGLHKFTLRRFDEAINIFSFYVNLYSDDEKLKEVLLLLGNSYKADAQVSAALTIYNLIIDKYPDSKEANESILAMALLGIDKPGTKTFHALANITYYKNPIDAYDTLLLKNPTGDFAQVVLLQKGESLHKLKRDKKAAEAYLAFLNLYPQSKMIGEAKKGLKIVSGSMIAEHYQKKDYLAVADIYFKAYSAAPLQADEYETVDKIATSLKELSLVDDYIKILNDYKNVCKDDKILVKVLIGIAEGEMARDKYNDAEKIFSDLLSKPEQVSTQSMSVIKKNMAEISYRKGLYDKAVADFDAVINSGEGISNPGPTYWHYAASLKGKKDNSRALQNYLIAVKHLNQEKKLTDSSGEAYKETGDLYFQTNNYKNSVDMYNKAFSQTSNPDLKYWSLFYSGQSYLKMDKNNDAQKVFTQIKTESGPESFWTKIVDYHLAEQKWWDKYGEYVKK